MYTFKEEVKTSNFCMKKHDMGNLHLTSHILRPVCTVQRAIQLASQLRILASHFHHFKPKFLFVLKPIILCTFWGIFLKQKIMSQFCGQAIKRSAESYLKKDSNKYNQLTRSRQHFQLEFSIFSQKLIYKLSKGVCSKATSEAHWLVFVPLL